MIKTSNKKFSNLGVQERVAYLVQQGYLNSDQARHLLQGQLDTHLAEQCIENVVGYFQLPIGVAEGFVIDGRSYMIPMAVEETSIIAAASKTAKWIQKQQGSITTQAVSQWAHGQIQIARPQNVRRLKALLHEHKVRLINLANAHAASNLVARGGGVRDLTLRHIKTTHAYMAVVHVYVDVCDAMGANLINQVCEFLKPHIEQLTGEQVSLCIVSNLADQKISRAEVLIPNIEASLSRRIEQASQFAHIDPYRACTHNKGILNGIDAVLIATGNDWRAVEAGLHAWAARSGQYRALSSWSLQGSHLVGRLEGPFMLGTVGGMTALHPTARAMLKMLGVQKASQLAGVCAAVGLVQNLGALKALVTQGIVEGHMRLHCKNLAAQAGAQKNEAPQVVQSLQATLKQKKRISLNEARQCLAKLRV